MATKSKQAKGPIKNGRRIKVIAASGVPLDRLFRPWQLVDWRAVSREIDEGNAVRLADVAGDAHAMSNWERCAIEQLGAARVSVVYDDTEESLWVLPRAMTEAIALDDEELCT